MIKIRSVFQALKAVQVLETLAERIAMRFERRKLKERDEECEVLILEISDQPFEVYRILRCSVKARIVDVQSTRIVYLVVLPGSDDIHKFNQHELRKELTRRNLSYQTKIR